MPKNRNKHHLSQQKIQEAQYKNIFFRRLGKFCISITGEDILSMVPGDELDLLYHFRRRPISVEPERGEQIPLEIIESVKAAIKDSLKKTFITNKAMVNISLADYFYFGIPLFVLISRMRKSNDKNSEKICYLLRDHFGNLNTIQDKLHIEIVSIFPSLIILNNNFCSGYYAYRLALDDTKRKFRASYKIWIKNNPPQMTHIIINNNLRPAFRIGWTDNNMRFKWIYVNKVQLGFTSTDKRSIPVFIQMHALQRLEERLDCIPVSLLQSNVFNSLCDCKIIHDKGSFLIEYRINNVKVGYLSAILIKGKLVIRTFLFLTCTDTPEGKRLQNLVGLQKLDASYMKMDKLSTYMSSKLSTNEELRSIFEKADCTHLLELFRKLDTVSKIHSENSPLDILTGYLRSDVRPKYRNTYEKHDISAPDFAYRKDINNVKYDIIRIPGRIITFIISRFRSIWNKKAVSNY